MRYLNLLHVSLKDVCIISDIGLHYKFVKIIHIFLDVYFLGLALHAVPLTN